MPTLVMQDGRPVALGAADILRMTLENRRKMMNQGGPFDRQGNAERYQQAMDRGMAIGQQGADNAARERLQIRDIAAQLGMQGNELRSRYDLTNLEGRQRQQLQGQSDAASMARLQSELGFRAGEGMMDRQHAGNMALLDAKLREQAADTDFDRQMKRLAAEYGISKEQATVAFQRAMQEKQQDFTNEKERMGLASHYDMRGAEQKFGFDTKLQGQDADLRLRNQESYWDRYQQENQALNEQRFTLDQKRAQQEIDQRKDEQFDMAINDLRGKYENLDDQGKGLLREVEAGLADIEASTEQNGQEWARAARQKLLGKVTQALRPERLKPTTFRRGDREFTVGPKGEWMPVNQPERVRAMTAEEAANGILGFDQDMNPRIVAPPQRPSTGSFKPDTSMQDMAKMKADFIANMLKTPKGQNALGAPVNYTAPEAAGMFDDFIASQMRPQQPQPPSPTPDMLQAHQMMDQMNRERALRGSAPGQPPMGPQQQPMGPQPQPGMLQRPQPPRPQNMMGGNPQAGAAPQGMQQAAMSPMQRLAMAAQTNPQAAEAYRTLDQLQRIPEANWGQREQQAYLRAVQIIQQLGASQ